MSGQRGLTAARSIRCHLAAARGAATDAAARLLISATDAVASRSRVPNPVGATRIVLSQLADQNLSGADFYDEVTYRLARAGFTWPAGLCDICNAELTEDQAERTSLCQLCDGDAPALALAS
ncbi:hypothetical protein ACFY4B_27320 [Kitasatospora sp. NPDC001261]|uniref:hypothetical protein n=1 Tax=Kitasatospora sp. NPDC001261 TaxID=3364012 RepID=UPI0036945A72